MPVIHDRPSPHFDTRPQHDVRYLILHYTACDYETALKCLIESQPPHRVSAHYLVDEKGRIERLVSEEKRAWHAGYDSKWGDDVHLNATSIGIEIVHLGHAVSPLPPYDIRQLAAVQALCLDIIARWSIKPWHVLGHSDIAIGRKIDPGEHFPWSDFAEKGIGLYPPQHLTPLVPKNILAYQHALKNYGYPCPLSSLLDAETQEIIRAFQRHFSPSDLSGTITPQDYSKLLWLNTQKQSVDPQSQ